MLGWVGGHQQIVGFELISKKVVYQAMSEVTCPSAVIIIGFDAGGRVSRDHGTRILLQESAEAGCD